MRNRAALMPQVTAALTAYDEGSRTLAYRADGMPAFITVARSVWTITPAGQDSCRVTVTANPQTHDALGLLGCWAILA